MNLLIIDEEYPYPLNTGKRIRTFNLINVLKNYHQISYLAYGNIESESYQFMKDQGFNPVYAEPPDRRQSGINFYLKLLANLTSPLPYIVTSHYTNHFQNKLDSLINSNKIDLIICEWTPYAIFLQNLKNVKSLISAHNIESSIWKRYEENEKNCLKRKYISIQRKKVEEFENKAFHWSSGATAVTKNEAETITAMNPPYSIEVIDNGVDTSYFKKSTSAKSSNELVFTGSMDWRPNQDAVIYFAKEIYPLVKNKCSDIKFTIVGRKPPEKVIELGHIEGITVTGTVDDVRPYIDRANLYIVPLRIGGGSRLKILEAMSMEKAVISTSIGAEGLNVTDNENIILKNTPTEFADCIIDLLQNNELRVKLESEGRKLVEKEYDWQQLGVRYNNYINRILEQK